MNRTNASRFTSLSFTVEDDLISQASISTYIPKNKYAKNPFSNQYPIKSLTNIQTDRINNNSNNILKINTQDTSNQNNIPFYKNKYQQRIRQQAQRQAYKQLNNEFYNPFQHKLKNTFIPQQQNLYQTQKQKHIQLLKRKEQEQLNNNKNYTILFHNNNNKAFQLTANNLLNQNQFSIQDYYNKNIYQKKIMKEIVEEDNQNQLNQNQSDFINNKPKNNHKFNLKQNAKIKTNNNHSIKPQSQTNIKKIKPQSTASNSNHSLLTQNKKSVNKTSIQKPNTSKQIKKPVNNFINNTKPQKPQIPKPKNLNNKNTSNNKKNQNKNTLNNQGKKLYSEVYQGPDRNLIEQIQTQIAQKTNVTFQQIAQLQNAKNLLQQAVLLPKIMPQFFKGIRKAMKGILMFGPPGTGKTLLAKAVANDNMFFNVSASSLASKWKGQSQKMVRILFEMARYYAPSIIFFDQIDAIASKRSQNEHQSSRKVKTQLLVQMDGVQSSDKQIFVLAATNRPWDLDQALRRRLQKRIYIPLPEKQGRKKMFEINLKQVKLDAKINWQRIVKQTEGYSGADISNVCRDAAYMPMRRMLAKVGIKKIGQINEKQLLDEELSEKDLIQAIKNNKPSVNMQDLKRYESWMKEFGAK